MGVRLLSAECGLSSLYSFLQASRQARASASEVNHEAFNSSCRSLALNDPMQAFCCGFPGVRDAVVGRLVQSA